MLEYDDPYWDYFNPEDISQWTSKSPVELMKAMMPVINEKIQGIGAVASAIKDIPGIDKIRGERWQTDSSVGMFMDQIVDETLRINRILRVGMEYIYHLLDEQSKDDHTD